MESRKGCKSPRTPRDAKTNKSRTVISKAESMLRRWPPIAAPYLSPSVGGGPVVSLDLRVYLFCCSVLFGFYHVCCLPLRCSLSFPLSSSLCMCSFSPVHASSVDSTLTMENVNFRLVSGVVVDDRNPLPRPVVFLHVDMSVFSA